MTTEERKATGNLLDIENTEWRESLDYVLQSQGGERVRQLLRLLHVLDCQVDGVVRKKSA